MTTVTLATVTRPSEDALIGIDRALSVYEHEIAKCKEAAEHEGLTFAHPSDLEECLEAAREWLMAIQSEIHRDDVANDR